MIRMTVFVLLLSSAALAQTEDEIAAAYKACEPHLRMVQTNPSTIKGSMFVPRWDEGLDGCAKIVEVWQSTEAARVERARKAKEDADREVVEALAKKLKWKK